MHYKTIIARQILRTQSRARSPNLMMRTKTQKKKKNLIKVMKLKILGRSTIIAMESSSGQMKEIAVAVVKMMEKKNTTKMNLSILTR